MDAAAHVHNLVYLRWCESARVAYFEEMGMDLSFRDNVAGPILGFQNCKYIFPITFPDNAIVGIRCIEAKEDRIVLQAAVFSERHDRIAAISVQEIVPYNYAELRKVALPEAWKTAIKRIEDN